MAGLNKWFIVLFLIVAGLTACREVEHVFIQNKTAQTISFEAILMTESGRQTLAADIAPGESDGWRFETAGGAEEIDRKLKRLDLTNADGCTVELNRSQIVDIAVKGGAWSIMIDENLIDCE